MIERLIDLLHTGGYSCVVMSRREVRTFTQRGVADLYDLYRENPSFMKGASIADKVVGKGAAALMVLGKVETVYADVISTPALTLLREANVEVIFRQEVPFIENREKTGWCPLESACSGVKSVGGYLSGDPEFYYRNPDEEATGRVILACVLGGTAMQAKARRYCPGGAECDDGRGGGDGNAERNGCPPFAGDRFGGESFPRSRSGMSRRCFRC